MPAVARPVAVNRSKLHDAHIREINVYLEKQQAEILRILAEFERKGKPFIAHPASLIPD